MPCLGLPAYDADILNYYERDYAVFVRKRTNPTGIPFEGNTLTVQESVTEYCKKAAGSLGLKAIHDMDLMTNSRGETVILEVNPRPSGSIATSMVSGFPIIDWAVGGLFYQF